MRAALKARTQSDSTPDIIEGAIAAFRAKVDTSRKWRRWSQAAAELQRAG